MHRFQYWRIYYSSHGYIPQSVIIPNAPREAWLMYVISRGQDNSSLVCMLSKKPGTFKGAHIYANDIFPECGREYFYPHAGLESFNAKHYLHPDQIHKISGVNHAKFLIGNHGSDLNKVFEVGKVYQDEWGSGYRIQILSRTKHTATYQVFDGFKILPDTYRSKITVNRETRREFMSGYAGRLFYGHYWPNLTEYSSLDDCYQLEQSNRQRRQDFLAKNPKFNYSIVNPGYID